MVSFIPRFRWQIWLLVVVAPFLLFVALSVIFHEQVVRDMPVAWVDDDHSASSRALFRQLDASPSLEMRSFPTMLQAEEAMREGSVYGFVAVPANFSVDLITHRQPVIRAVVNGQVVLIAKVIRSAIASVIGVDQAVNRAFQTLELTASATSAAFNAAPVQVQLSSLYNRAGSYGQFLLPAIFLAIWQILIAITSVVYLTERPVGQEASEVGWIAKATSLYQMIQRLANLTPWFVLQGVVAGAILRGYFGYPFFGSPLYLIAFVLLFIVTCQALAWAICLVVPADPAKATSLTGAITAPSFAFLGVTFPSSEMPMVALWWRDILPAAQSSELMLALANYGVIAFNPLPALLCQLVLMLLPFVLYQLVYRAHPHELAR